MANATVEKLKESGLRYGDKVAVGLASLVCVICLGLALTKPTIDLTPEQIKKAAEASETNLKRPMERDNIIKILTDGGIKDTNFAKEAEDSTKTVLVADNYRPEREWVTPEPGAGLIRDTPVLIPPTELYAYPGRGGALVYALDAEGNKIVDNEPKEAPKVERKGRRRRRSAAGGMGGMMGMMGGGRGTRKAPRKSQADIERELKAEEEQRKREMAARLTGRDEPASAKEETAKAEGAEAAGTKFKEITKGLRWVAITGVLDHAKLLANYKTALKNPAVAHPNYARLDLQRQTRQQDDSWSDWESVDAERNLTILDNLPENDEELAPTNVLPDNLVDPLPFLSAGLWEKVHIASLVPKEKKEVPKAQLPSAMGGMGGYEQMMGGGKGNMEAMMRGMGASMGGMRGMGASMGGMGGMMGGMRGMGASMGGMGGMMGGMGASMGGTEVGNFWKSEEPKVMIRALDFTAEPDNRYRYRVRIVVFNPNKGRDDVSPGVDKKATELFGPWSEPTDEVDMPADVSAYAMGSLPASPKSDMRVKFQVVKFNNEDGVTVPRNFDAGPGDVIGELRTADIPVSDGTGTKAKPVDFSSHQIVLDVDGGWRPLPSGFPGERLDRPAMALLLRPDGGVMVRTQANDEANEVRKDIERTYAKEIKDSSKVRENSMGGGYGGMMGGMMRGMMGGGGMGGMMGGGRR